FLIPVDTKIVTDYASIIKNPMDFGTMQKKIDTKQYTKISEFQHDFELVIQNAKTYNAPETIYYRSADKISKFGSRLIEREITTIKNVEEKRRLYFQEIRRASKANSNTSATTTPNNIPEKNSAVTNDAQNAPSNMSTPNKFGNVNKYIIYINN
ncbi:Bromodomain-containing protein, partial [Anaeromyces robustus]